ncbi:MAG: amino acid adenylation domain-containing protein [Proteobacteria bacterium]|nr:amino acid adenylation domain-containing protein [Pseudomonadota bacterium]
MPANAETALVTAARLEQGFARNAAVTPEAPAIIFRGRVVSYGELDAEVESMARDLSRHGAGPGVLVAICLKRTPSLVAALLATLRSGGAYLPLDLRYPPDRLRFVLADSGASILLTDCTSPGFSEFGGAVLQLSGGDLIQRAYRAAPVASAPPDLAYLLYTSGSTGAPKGVMLGHEATHLVAWARDYYAPEDLSRVAATTSVAFDPSVLEIFVPLCTGGAVILKENALEPFAADERPTLLNSVPSALAELCRANAIPPSLSVLHAGGEVLTGDLARELYRGRPSLTLYNHYGPTEATTCATVARVPRRLEGEPSIGRPVRGAEIVLLSADGSEVAEGQTGEIHIGGPGLALGYLNRPDLTAARFFEGPSGRLYRTGDLGLWIDGELRFAGRVDQQVKVRGFRVELGEIESSLVRVPQVEAAVATLREASGRSQIVAYVQSQQPLTPAGVKETLGAWLPDYMVPARIVILRALPRLVSGKIDYNALPGPDEEPKSPATDVSRMERPIIHVFEEVLARSPIGPRDSFFDLGGDSLASVQAALRLEELLGYELPAALIHQSPTPHQLARSLEHGRVRADSHISLLQLGGPAPPLFCVSDLFGQPFNYLALARRLEPERSVYGVAPGPLQEAFTQDGDIARLTRSFCAELRALQPRGPYLIAGYSAGGMLALDLACALEREGEAVSLILLDSLLHSRRPSAVAIVRWSARRARQLIEAPRGAARSPRVGVLLAKFLRQMVPGAPSNWVPRSQVAFAMTMIKAGSAYRPPDFFGRTLIVKAEDRDPIDQLFDADGHLGWSDTLKGEVMQTTVPGGHHQFMREPLVAETAFVVEQFCRGLVR